VLRAGFQKAAIGASILLVKHGEDADEGEQYQHPQDEYLHHYSLLVSRFRRIKILQAAEVLRFFLDDRQRRIVSGQLVFEALQFASGYVEQAADGARHRLLQMVPAPVQPYFCFTFRTGHLLM
jgi:hypothetical protein